MMKHRTGESEVQRDLRKMEISPQTQTEGTMTDLMRDELGVPKVVDRGTFQSELDVLRVREKAHTRAGDAIAAARRRLPMVEVDGATPLIGKHGAVTLLDAFEGRQMLMAYYFMWHTSHPAPEQCEGCTWVTSHVRELSYLYSRDVTYAVLCQGPYEQSARYRDFMGWELPWYSAQHSLDTLLVGRKVGKFHLVCYLRQGSKVFETYWTTGRGAEVMDNSYDLLDLTVYGRQEMWEDSPPAGHNGLRQASSPYRWTSHRPVVSPEGWAFGRPGNRQALNRPVVAPNLLLRNLAVWLRRCSREEFDPVILGDGKGSTVATWTFAGQGQRGDRTGRREPRDFECLKPT